MDEPELKRIALLANVLLLGPARWEFASGEEWARAGVRWYLEHWGDEGLRALPRGCSTVEAARAWLELARWAAHEPLPQLFAEPGAFARAQARWWAQLPEGCAADVEAANPYGCNQYRHAPGCPHVGEVRGALLAAGFSEAEIATMGQLPVVDMSQPITEIKRATKSRLRGLRRVMFTNGASGINAEIQPDTEGEVFSAHNIQKTQRQLVRAGVCNYDTAAKIQMAAGSIIDELYEKAPRCVEQELKAGGSKGKERALHFSAPFNVKGIERPLVADISVIKFRKRKEPTLYALNINVKVASANRSADHREGDLTPP